MFAVVTSNKTQLRPGAVLHFPGSWEEYCAIASQRGDSAIPRVKYRQGEIILMSPLPEHGYSADLVADIVKAFLASIGQNYVAYTPITMKLSEVGGIEPDYCFYITNWQAVVGKKRIDWTIDPPPDLVIEIDVTNYTDVNDYLIYRVPEVWLLKGERLAIYLLTEERYVTSERSQFFSARNATAIVAECLSAASTLGSGIAMQQLRRRLEQR